LAWAAYGAGDSREAADLVRSILKVSPGDAAVVCPGTGFVPLHDAAWGNAASEVAVTLCLFYPEAVFARGRSGETPHTVGRSMHRRFSWPRPAELLAAAANLLRRRGEEELGVPTRTAERIERCVAAVGGRQHSDDRDDCALQLLDDDAVAPLRRLGTAWYDDSETQPAAQLQRRRRRRHAAAATTTMLALRRQRRRRAAAGAASVAEWLLGAPLGTDVLHLCEAQAKSGGRLAGASEVRHSRCGFTEQVVVAVGDRGCTHRLRLHRVRTINESVQRGHTVARWPSKAPMRRERALERSMKRAVAFDAED
jgi:hypothetical protein